MTIELTAAHWVAFGFVLWYVVAFIAIRKGVLLRLYDNLDDLGKPNEERAFWVLVHWVFSPLVIPFGAMAVCVVAVAWTLTQIGYLLGADSTYKETKK